MKLKELCAAIRIDCPAAAEEIEIPSITTHSGEVEEGGMFICIRGLHTDGHGFIPEALERGARVILCETGHGLFEASGTLRLEHPEPRRATARLYDAWYGYPSSRLRFLGVTGTNGKTSVTHLLRRILESSLYRCGLIGTVGCESFDRTLDGRGSDPLANMTTPDPPELYRMLGEMVEDGVEYVVMEVTSHALALGKLDPIRFQVSVFTNLTPEHLDFHGTMDAYAAAKSELFARSDCSVINLDSPYAQKMMAMADGDIVTCSAEGRNATYQVTEIERLGDRGVSYRLSSPNRRLRIGCPIPGRFTVMNSMQAAAAALELGVGASTVKEALSTVAGVKGRMQRVRLGPDADVTVLIDYAHTPDALENLLRTAAELKRPEGQLLLLFGCGGDRDRGKRARMGSIAARLADEVYLTSDNSRGEDPLAILSEIECGFGENTNYKIIPDRERAIRRMVAEAREGDLLLLAGKGHENYEIGRDGRRPFCEEQIVKDAFMIRRNRQRQQNGKGAEKTRE